jgi:hypothetical protein
MLYGHLLFSVYCLMITYTQRLHKHVRDITETIMLSLERWYKNLLWSIHSELNNLQAIMEQSVLPTKRRGKKKKLNFILAAVRT